MDEYITFESQVKRMTIDEVADKIPCPKCGGELSFVYVPDEIYKADGTFVRNEVLRCQKCWLEVEVEQVYKPMKCYVTEFHDEFCEENEEEEEE